MAWRSPQCSRGPRSHQSHCAYLCSTSNESVFSICSFLNFDYPSIHNSSTCSHIIVFLFLVWLIKNRYLQWLHSCSLRCRLKKSICASPQSSSSMEASFISRIFCFVLIFYYDFDFNNSNHITNCYHFFPFKTIRKRSERQRQDKLGQENYRSYRCNVYIAFFFRVYFAAFETNMIQNIEPCRKRLSKISCCELLTCQVICISRRAWRKLDLHSLPSLTSSSLVLTPSCA